jgi:ELWxxDGT repeat protein
MFKKRNVAQYRKAHRSLRIERLERKQLLAIDLQLLKDIQTRPSLVYSEPKDFVQVGSLTFFTAQTPTYGRELWRTDGTADGTSLVKDLLPGETGSNPTVLTNVNGTLFFTASLGGFGTQLWTSDGTSAGTKVISPPLETFRATTKTGINFNGTFYFSAFSNGSGEDLWKSDGTAAGTVLVAELDEGNSSLDKLTKVNNSTMYFTAVSNYSSEVTELWKTDGTRAGTIRLQAFTDILGSYATSAPNHLTNVNGTLFFVAGDESRGVELWKSNGTVNGTRRVKDVRSGEYGSYGDKLANVNGMLYFFAKDSNDEIGLWKSDGTGTGTTLVKNVRRSTGELRVLEGTMYFTLWNVQGAQLWKSDGTAAGTVSLKDLGLDTIPVFNKGLESIDGTLYFSVKDKFSQTIDSALWKSDGTVDGTVIVKEFNTPQRGLDSTFPRSLFNANGKLLCTANDGIRGSELWTSNGTEAGTTLVNDIAGANGDSTPSKFVEVNGSQYFVATSSVSGREIWKTDGTAAGTVLLKDIRPGSKGSDPQYLTNVSGTLFFSANDRDGVKRLWKSNGTSTGTVRVSDDLEIKELANVNGLLFFTANDGTNGFELWKSNGTTAGTEMVRDIQPSTGQSSLPYSLVNCNGTLFFSANDGVVGSELWKSDGSAAGTVLVKDIYPGDADSFLSSLTAVGNRLYFSALASFGRELWTSDGTEAGTKIVQDLAPSSSSSYPTSLTNVNGTLLFVASKIPNSGVYKVNSSATGASLVKQADVRGRMTNLNGVLYFGTRSSSDGGLWKTNGSVSGTRLVKRIVSTDGFSLLSDLTNINGRMFFAAETSVSGRELWQSDGTASGTRIAADLASGSGASFPNSFTYMNGKLLVIGTTESDGQEVFVGDLPPFLAIRANSSIKNEGDVGSTPFTFTVRRTGIVTGATTVEYIVSGEGANPATASDFIGGVFPSGVVTFAAGQMTRTITINVLGDRNAEGNERFSVLLRDASGDAILTAAKASGIIRNDEPTLAIAATSATKPEGNASAFTAFTFTITRTGNLTGTSTVDYAVTGTGATANDFVGGVFPSGQFTFAVNQASLTITIQVKPDFVAENNETFRVTLSNAIGASIATAFATGTILDDDTLAP